MAIKAGGKGAVSEINVTPMVDIMLVLLIIFMVITPMLKGGHPVDMAETNNSRDMNDAQKEDAVIIAIDRTGKLYMGNNMVQLDDVTSRVKDGLANKNDRTVYLRSDARAKYGVVVKVVDAIRAAGVEQLGLLAERIEKRGPAGAPAVATP